MLVRAVWHPWSVAELIEATPELLEVVESHLGQFSEDYREKNMAVIEALRQEPLTAEGLRTGSRTNELATIGFALDVLARAQETEEPHEERLKWFEAAHEIFRAGNRLQRPARPMQQVVYNALRLVAADGVEHIAAGEGDAGVLLEEIGRFVAAAWGTAPPEAVLTTNEILLNELESCRLAHENDPGFHRKFVADNIEAVLSMEIPTRLGQVLERWIEIGEHVAPAAARIAQRKFRRPTRLSELIPSELRTRLERAVELGDTHDLGTALSEIEDRLEANLRLRLNARPDYREPEAELRYQGGPDRFFEEARGLLTRHDGSALDAFRNLHIRKPGHPIVNEWYAYVLTVMGRSTDIHEIIDLLEEAITSKYFRPEFGWTTRWNLACALGRLPLRAKESLGVLLPVLENEYHTAEAFEMCLLWALEQDRDDVVGGLLLKSPQYEAHLLAALQDTRAYSTVDEPERFHKHFRRLSRILREPDRVFPDPLEQLREIDLEELTQGFIENALVDAGIEWFRQRLTSDRERRFYKNWESAARLHEVVGDRDAVWRCRERQWHCTQNNKKLSQNQKARLLRSTLTWAERNGFEQGGLRILREGWRLTGFTEADVQLWERRLQKTSSGTAESRPQEGEKGHASPPSGTATGEKRAAVEAAAKPASGTVMTVKDAEAVIQKVAGSFRSVGNADTLAEKAEDAEQLIMAVAAKHGLVPPELASALREMLRLAIAFHRGVDEEQGAVLAGEMRNQIEVLRRHTGSTPFELNGLLETYERVSRNASVRVKAVPDLVITPPGDLGLALDTPARGERYLTRLCARLANPSVETMSNIVVAFSSASPHLRILISQSPVGQLSPQDKRVVECPVEVSDGIEVPTEARVFVTYEVGNIKRSLQTAGGIRLEEVTGPIPITERYVTSRPVRADRKDLFHGRDRELKDLLKAFAGGQLRKLYFVNGIRRVGKSSMLEHLASKSETDTVPLVINVEEALDRSAKMTVVQFAREVMRDCIAALAPTSVPMPADEKFNLDPPWVVFESFLEEVLVRTNRRNVLLCLDELQGLVKRVADAEDPMDESFLSWLRAKIQKGANTLIVCTGSEPYTIMRRRYEHNLWGNMEPYNVSFVDRAAMKKIATLPVEPDKVAWLPEALDRLWDMTEGHPWGIQLLAERACERLNEERRRLVLPGDVEAAAELLVGDGRLSDYWWNETTGLITSEHREVAFLILQYQKGSRLGVVESELGEICQRAGLRNIGRLLEEMRSLELLSGVSEGTDIRWRIRGAFLERFLAMLEQRESQERGKVSATSSMLPLALMLDWENVKIQLSKFVEESPTEQQPEMRARLETVALAQRLFEAASRHGVPRQRWAVANWENAFFRGDQADFRKQIRFETDMSGVSKADASDHVLRERVHEVLREHPEISSFVIATGDADFAEAIRTLQSQGKRVVLWSTRSAISSAYKYLLSGPDAVTIEWLEDLVFGADALQRQLD